MRSTNIEHDDQNHKTNSTQVITSPTDIISRVIPLPTRKKTEHGDSAFATGAEDKVHDGLQRTQYISQAINTDLTTLDSVNKLTSVTTTANIPSRYSMHSAIGLHDI